MSDIKKKLQHVEIHHISCLLQSMRCNASAENPLVIFISQLHCLSSFLHSHCWAIGPAGLFPGPLAKQNLRFWPSSLVPFLRSLISPQTVNGGKSVCR